MYCIDLNKQLFTSIVLLIGMVYSVAGYASLGCPTNVLSVPFSNYSLNNNCGINATYAFGNNNNVLFCYAGAAMNPGLVYWPYNGTRQVGTMPIPLVISSNYQGYFADKSGTLTVFNNTGFTEIVNCVFAL